MVDPPPGGAIPKHLKIRNRRAAGKRPAPGKALRGPARQPTRTGAILRRGAVRRAGGLARALLLDSSAGHGRLGRRWKSRLPDWAGGTFCGTPRPSPPLHSCGFGRWCGRESVPPTPPQALLGSASASFVSLRRLAFGGAAPCAAKRGAFSPASASFAGHASFARRSSGPARPAQAASLPH
jgi:hypothetical protein